MNHEAQEKSIFVGFSFLAAIATVAWCYFLSHGNIEHFSIAFVTCCAAFAVGSLFGFLFTIFGDEIRPFGKIQNSVIAVASGIAGIGLAKINAVGAKLGEIQLFPAPSAMNSWFSAFFVVTYCLAGFYFMYLLRTLVLNPALAKARAEVNRIQLSGSAEDAAIQVAKILTPGVLLGRAYIADIVEANDKQAAELRSQLYSSAVSSFLEGCEKDLASGVEISPDSITRVALIHYYRTYFETKGSDGRKKQEQLAEAWLNRALLRDPLDLGLRIKLADIYGMQERYEEAAAILERLERDDSSPQYVQQWLGYFLLYAGGKEQEAIRHSLEYHERFPGDAAAVFNAARGYAQLYSIEARKRGATEIPNSKDRRRSLQLLRESIEIDPGARAYARKYAVPGDSFELLASDNEFKQLIAEPPAARQQQPPQPAASQQPPPPSASQQAEKAR